MAAGALAPRRPFRVGQADPLRTVLGPAYALIERRYYVDELYGLLIVRPYRRLADALARIVDERSLHDFVHKVLLVGGYERLTFVLAHAIDHGAIDGGIERAALSLRGLAYQLRKAQSGYVRRYITWFVLGAVGLLALFAFRRLS